MDQFSENLIKYINNRDGFLDRKCLATVVFRHVNSVYRKDLKNPGIMNNSNNVQDGSKEDEKEMCWKRRSRLEKKLIIFACIILTVAIILVAVFGSLLARPQPTCLSSSCIQTANELLEYMDLDVNPCDDFYQFACGNFLNNVVLDESKSKNVNTFLAKSVYNRIRKILEEPLYEFELKSLSLANKFYKACTNETAIEEKGLTLMKKSLKQIGGWPVLVGNSWVVEKFDWKIATYKLRELGFGFEFFIVLEIGVDKNDPSKHTIEIHSPFSPLYRIPEEGEDYFHSYMVNVSVAFGADRVRAKNDFRDVINFKRSLFLDEDYDDKYEILTISELKNKLFDIPWLEYINKLLYPVVSISHQQFVTLHNPRYFARLQSALRRTPKRVIANYIAWRTVRNHREYLPKLISDIKWTWYYTDEENPTRAMTCFRLTYDNFRLPIEAVYAKRYLSKELKSDATVILNNIKSEFKKTITDLDWVDADTTIRGLEKLSTVANYVAFADELLNSEDIEQEYMEAQVEQDNFLASILNIRFHQTNYRFKKLQRPVNEVREVDDGFVMAATTYYDESDNILVVPGRILQGVIYGYNRPKYLNYGTLGSGIGHEMSHIIFGPRNNQPEETRNILSTVTRLSLNEKLSCLTIHYGKYRVPEIDEHLNSSHTKTEDFADIVGTKLAYDAYNKWEDKNGPEQKLPGLNYTSRQLFWISSAVRFCEKLTQENLQYRITHPSGSPKKYRVLGTLRNLEEFARDFNCPVGSYMNDNDRCNLW